MTNIVDGHDLDTQSGRADYRNEGGWVEGSSSGGYDYDGGHGGGTQAPTQGATYTTSGTTSNPSTTTTSTINDSQQNIEFFNQQAEALKNQAAVEAAKIAYSYWHDNQVTIPGLQLDRDKFAFSKAVQAADEAYRQADLDLRKIAELHGHEIETGKLDLAKLAEKHQNELGIANLGLDVMKLVASLQADPFRQQQVINGLNDRGYSKAVDAARGLSEQPAFQAPNGSAADTRTLEYLGGRLGSGSSATDLIRQNQAAFDANMAGMPQSGTEVVARSFNKMDTPTKQFILSGISANSGLSMDTENERIQATLPKFRAPSGSVATT